MANERITENFFRMYSKITKQELLRGLLQIALSTIISASILILIGLLIYNLI